MSVLKDILYQTWKKTKPLSARPSEQESSPNKTAFQKWMGRQSADCRPDIFLNGRRIYSAKARHKKVTICARVQSLLGLKVVALVPPVMPFSAAHRTALL